MRKLHTLFTTYRFSISSLLTLTLVVLFTNQFSSVSASAWTYARQLVTAAETRWATAPALAPVIVAGPLSSAQLQQMSKEQRHERMRELRAQIRARRVEMARAVSASEKASLASQRDALMAEYQQISESLGGDEPSDAPQAANEPAGSVNESGQLSNRLMIAPPVPSGCTLTATTASNATAQAITDNATTTSTIVVAGAGTYLWDVDALTTITHAFNSDLDITLTSPAGTVVTLTSDNGGSNDNVFNGTTWDDSANPGGTVPHASTGGNNGLVTDHAYVNNTLASPLAPEDKLAAFIGENPNGTWTLRIHDDQGADTGSLANWSLTVNTLPAAPIAGAPGVGSNNTAVAIPDNAGSTTSTITIAGAGPALGQVIATINIPHTFNSDLQVTLTSPAGTVVTLTSNNGGGNDNGFAGTAFVDTADPGNQVPFPTNTFAASNLVTDTIYTNLVAKNPLVPEEALGAFIGQNPNGVWTLTMADTGPGDLGTLNGWRLDITTHSACYVPAPTMTLVDPLNCNGPGDLVSGSVTLVNTTNAPQTGTVTTTLPPSIVGIAGTCVSSIANCTINAAMVSWSGTIPANGTLTYSYQAQIANDVVSGQVLTATTTAVFGNQTGTVTASLTVNCPSQGPGLPHNPQSQISDQKPGSILAYPIYTSDAANAAAQNTRLAITNTNPSRSAFVHLFFVDGSSCSVADSYICLTPNQTASVLASDIDPGTSGYVLAIATDAGGCPTNFNYLIGDEYVKFASGHQADLAAESIAALAGGLTACNAATASSVELKFDGVSYNALPRVLAASSLPSRADGNDTMLIVNRLGGSLLTNASTLGTLFGLLYDDAERAYSFSLAATTCQSRGSLTNDRPRVVPRYDQVISAGRSGWLKISGGTDIGIFGAQINRNANAASNAGAFNQGHNLHKLTLTTTQSVTIPIFPPSC